MSPSSPGGRLTTDTRYSGARLLVDTVAALSERAPSVVAAAASQMSGIMLGLHFGDGTTASLVARHSRLIAGEGSPSEPDVEVVFDVRAMNLIFDLQRRPSDQVLPESLDVRGGREHVLAVWRAFAVLSQRASGLRAVQGMWREFREQSPQLWGATVPPPPVAPPGEHAAAGPSTTPRMTGWRALDYLDTRVPEHVGPPGSIGETVVTRGRLLWDGHRSSPWWDPLQVADADLLEIMCNCRARVADEMAGMIPDREPREDLYDLIRDYPARQGKGLRPTLTIAACAALGGRPQDAVRMAAALELFHNGFLIHDDIADESLQRRGRPTLSAAHGDGLAVNAGDALNLLAVDAVLSNLETLGLARTLGLIHEILHMCRETVEGQAVELGWIQRGIVPNDDDDYLGMCTKKTGWYTCMSPCRIGALCAGVTDPKVLDLFNEPLRLIGNAFQIQDDVLNLIGEEALYGKEPLGDLLEGKRTMMLIHLFREAEGSELSRMHEIIARRRKDKTQEDAEEVLAAMHRHGSIEYAIAVADRLANAGTARFESDLGVLPENEGKGVLRQVAYYVTNRPL